MVQNLIKGELVYFSQIKKIKDILNVGGRGLLDKYQNSQILLLSQVYPEYEWLPWKFEYSPRNFWNNEDNKLKYLEWAGKQLGIKELNDWYKCSKEVVTVIFFQVENKGHN